MQVRLYHHPPGWLDREGVSHFEPTWALRDYSLVVGHSFLEKLRNVVVEDQAEMRLGSLGIRHGAETSNASGSPIGQIAGIGDDDLCIILIIREDGLQLSCGEFVHNNFSFLALLLISILIYEISLPAIREIVRHGLPHEGTNCLSRFDEERLKNANSYSISSI